MAGHHRFELTSLEVQQCRLRNVECHIRLKVPLVKRLGSMLAAVEGFQNMNAEITQRAERLARQSGADE